MTNIYQINETAQAQVGQTQNKPRPEKTGEFDALLTNALDPGETAGAIDGTPALQELSAPTFDLSTPASVVTDKTDDLLGLLDQYASQLGDPGVSLKNLAPMIEQMNADANSLMQDARFLDTEEDSQLKAIATQTAATAQTEYVKFQRGDYLS